MSEPKYFVYEGISHKCLVTKQGTVSREFSVCGKWMLVAENCPPELFRVTTELETELCTKCATAN